MWRKSVSSLTVQRCMPATLISTPPDIAHAISRDLAQGAHIVLDWVATKTQSSAHARLDSKGVHVDSCAGALLVLKYRVFG